MATGNAYKEPRVGSKAIEYVLGIEPDLKLAIGFTLTALAFIYVPILNGTILRPMLGLAMVLFAPGYTLIASLFPRRSDIDAIERTALSFGLSIAVVPLIGLGLNYTPWGIRLDPIVACLAAFTVACSLIANERRHELVKEERFSVGPAKLYAIAKAAISADRTGLEKALTLILIASILASAVAAAYVIMYPKQGEKFTEFYILGPGGKAAGYPLRFTVGEQKPVIVGIVNHEYRNVTYDLVVALNDGGNVTQLHSERFVLGDNETGERMINVTSGNAGTGMKADFLLYLDEDLTVPYRECYLWVNVTGPATH
jgi:uncharacterized membrane protein